MTEEEIARFGDEYKAEIRRLFGFLVDALGFDQPVDVSSEYSHSLAYRSASRDLDVVFSNAFHPVDYGFEITLYPVGSPWHRGDRNTVFHVLKEQQDRELQFLSRGVPPLRDALADVHVG